MYQKDNCMTAEKIGFKIVQKMSWKAMHPHVNNILVNYGNDTFTLSRSLKYARFPYAPRFDQWTDELSDYFINMQFVKYISGWFDFRVDFLTKYLFLNFLYCYTTNK